MAKKIARQASKRLSPKRRVSKTEPMPKNIPKSKQGKSKIAILRTTQGEICRVSGGTDLQNYAMKWTYIIRNRQRWSQRTQSSSDLSKRAVLEFADLGVKEEHLLSMANAGLVEVSMPYIDDETGWELRIFPWEYMLSTATKLFRGDRHLTVIRHLDTAVKHVDVVPQKITILESAPGKLRDYFSFDAENKLVQASFPGYETTRIEDPTYDELKAKIKKQAPDILHVTAIDTHLGITLLEEEDIKEGLKKGRSGDVWDGLLLSGEHDQLCAAGSVQLADAINTAKRKPWLVVYNCWNSATRIAALTVGEGAQASIGFQTTFDDSLAELFFSHLYRALQFSKWNLLVAFLQAMDSIRAYPKNLQGTGIILWSAHSLVEKMSACKQSEAVKDEIKQRKYAILNPKSLKKEIRDLVDVDVRPYRDLNYSLIHNNRDLFERFTLRKPLTGCLRDICIRVQLSVGADSFPYQSSIDLIEPVTEIASLIRLPLTSELARTVDENLPTSLFVEVSHNGDNLYRDTHRITLLPTDQWRDDDRDRHWLPSFVMPRDPVVSQIIDSAQRYLICLADDPAAGFDGYQSFDPVYEDAWAGIDLQVQSIWATLTLDHAIYYINPPPTYRERSQRLRTPSQIISGNRGTCIDLALLFASCLEYIDIYPVIFLLEGHAFPGYWRSEEDYHAFRNLKVPMIHSIDTRQDSFHTRKNSESWLMGPDTFRELHDHVVKGNLVPLESVWLTQRTSFWEAYETGKENLQSKKDFHSMIDVLLARQSGVTPLPTR